MKLSLRHFLIGCVLFGAVGIPWVWNQWGRDAWEDYQRRRQQARIEKLMREFELLLDESDYLTTGEGIAQPLESDFHIDETQ